MNRNADTMNAPIAAPLLYPAVSEAALKSQYRGSNIRDLPTPAAIIDRAVAVRNCTDMLDAARSLELEFRPHVKTHKVGRVLSSLISYHAFRVIAFVSSHRNTSNRSPVFWAVWAFPYPK